MSLLAPWFLAGLALLAGPVIAHLIRRATRDRVSFSAVRFLTPSAPRLDRRSRIQHPLLLALRLLILALLALAFARPYFTGNTPLVPSTTPPRHVMVVLDHSASMRRDNLWSAARTRVAAIAADLSAQDDFTLLLADTRARQLISAETWRATAPGDRGSLMAGILDAQAEPGWSAFHLDDAVRAAIERHQELSAADNAAPSAPRIHLVSDLAAGTRVSGLASLAWPTGGELVLEPLDPGPDHNVALQWLGWGVAPSADASAPARVRLVAAPDTPTTSVRLTLRDPATGTVLGEPVTQVLSRGGTATVLVPVPADAPDALTLQLEGDDIAFDNQLWLVRPAPRRLPVVLLGDGDANDAAHPAYYLTRALAGWSDPVPVLRDTLPPVATGTAAQLPPFIIAPDAIPPGQLAAVREQLEAGGTALLLIANADSAARAAALLDETAWSVSSAVAGAADGYALFGQIDFSHSLFLPFADPRYSDFSRIRFWSRPHLSLPDDTRARVIARFDDGAPAVLEAPVGRGRLVGWAGSWTPERSQWVLSSKFVPWLQALAERTAGGPLRASISGLDELDRLGDYDTLTPTDAGSEAGTSPTAPGLYQLSRDNLPPRPVALNVPARESELTPLDLDVFVRLGAPVTPTTDEAAARAEADQRREEAAYLTESRQKLWRWLLLAAAILLIGESLLSLRLARRAAVST